jgi:hypothetical protein
MLRPRTLFRGILISAAAFTLACGDSATSATPLGDSTIPSVGSGPRRSPHGNQVAVAHRLSPLAEDEVVTHTIGPLGGAIHLPEAGLVVVVPPFAVSAPTTITVVAPAGDLVGYHFLPEGLVFRAPLLAAQNLLLTDAPAALLQGSHPVAAYVRGDEFRPVMQALELLPLDVTGALGTFSIHHFSGYVIATN